MKNYILKLIIASFVLSISFISYAQNVIPITSMYSGGVTFPGTPVSSLPWKAPSSASTEVITFNLASTTEKISNIYFDFNVCPYSFDIYGSTDGSTFTRITAMPSTYTSLGNKKTLTFYYAFSTAYKAIRITNFCNSYSNSPTYIPELNDIRFSYSTPLTYGSLVNDVTIASNAPVNFVFPYGNLNIGVGSTYYLELNTNRSGYIFNKTIFTANGQFAATSNQNLSLLTNGTSRMTILPTGNIGIGTANPTALLTVNGKIEAEEVEVKSVAADFVFDQNYKLKSLQEVENYIKANKHLPGVAPASETQQGVELSKFNTLLLQKIEELTLYMIELKKQNETLEAKVKELETKK